MPPRLFGSTKRAPNKFSPYNIETAVTREFCAECGTHILTRRQDMPQIVLKLGTLDDPAAGYGGPKMAIYTVDRQPFHLIAEGVPAFDRLPAR